MKALLETSGLSKSYRGLVVNDAIDFDIRESEIHCVIGPNGAGKTTLLSLLSGHVTASAGTITYNERDITRLGVVERARLGIVRKFQTPSIFEDLSVHDNIRLASCSPQADQTRAAIAIGQILEMVRLTGEHASKARWLSHGQRQWLEIGMLLASRGRLLLLDEPAAGLTGEEAFATVRLIRDIAENLATSIIVVEHNMDFIKALQARVTVLSNGKNIATGSFAEISANADVIRVYLGEDDASAE